MFNNPTEKQRDKIDDVRRNWGTHQLFSTSGFYECLIRKQGNVVEIERLRSQRLDWERKNTRLDNSLVKMRLQFKRINNPMRLNPKRLPR